MEHNVELHHTTEVNDTSICLNDEQCTDDADSCECLISSFLKKIRFFSMT